tara:strand:+ start:77 stop:850 length:774 start_codon:yes stop_codon:yes gene_type:complete
MYFLLALMETIPLTAYTQWLNEDVAMSQCEQSRFYAVIFLPWSLKPLYGWLSDRVPLCGRHRKPYIVACCVGAAACYLVTALWVRSVAGAYVVTIARSTCNAFSELMLGAVLVDVVSRDPRNAATIQSVATGVRSLASVTGFLVSLPLYPCAGIAGSLGTVTELLFGDLASVRDGWRPNHLAMIGASSVFALVAAAVALALPSAVATPRAAGTSRCGGSCSAGAQLGGVVVVVAQLFAVWVGLASLSLPSSWAANCR